jgi:hypothetical protein
LHILIPDKLSDLRASKPMQKALKNTNHSLIVLRANTPGMSPQAGKSIGSSSKLKPSKSHFQRTSV